MRVLIVSQYFAPERTAAALRLEPLARGLAERGHDVRVVAEIPSHPEGVVHPGYGRAPFVRRRRDGYEVRYVRTWARPSKRARDRLLSYGSYAAWGTLVAAAGSRPDVILASSPPLSVGAAGIALGRRFRTPWVFDVRDLWPEVAVALGELDSPRVIAAARRLEARCYREAAAVTVPTRSFAVTIEPAASGEVVLLANGTTRAWIEAGRRPIPRAELGVPDDTFLWTYAGNVGLSQDLGVAIEAAAALGDGYTLLVLGDGASRPGLERAAAERPDANVVFRDPVDPLLAARVMSASDALLVPLADDPILAKTMPVKLYDSCATGVPVIVAAPGEPRRAAEDEGIGTAVPPGDPAALAAAVSALRADPEGRRRIAAAAERFARAHLREHQVEPLEALLHRLAGG